MRVGKFEERGLPDASVYAQKHGPRVAHSKGRPIKARTGSAAANEREEEYEKQSASKVHTLHTRRETSQRNTYLLKLTRALPYRRRDRRRVGRVRREHLRQGRHPGLDAVGETLNERA